LVYSQLFIAHVLLHTNAFIGRSEDGSRSGLKHASQTRDQSSFTTAVMSQKSKKFPFLKIDTHVIQNIISAVISFANRLTVIILTGKSLVTKSE